MPPSINCPNCSRALPYKPEWIGKRASCKHCDHRFILGAVRTPIPEIQPDVPPSMRPPPLTDATPSMRPPPLPDASPRQSFWQRHEGRSSLVMGTCFLVVAAIRRHRGKWPWAVGAVVALVVVSFAMLPSAAEREAERIRRKAYDTSRFIAEAHHLSTPSTNVVSSYEESYIKVDGNVYTVVIRIDAENLFGAMVRTRHRYEWIYNETTGELDKGRFFMPL